MMASFRVWNLDLFTRSHFCWTRKLYSGVKVDVEKKVFALHLLLLPYNVEEDCQLLRGIYLKKIQEPIPADCEAFSLQPLKIYRLYWKCYQKRNYKQHEWPFAVAFSWTQLRP